SVFSADFNGDGNNDLATANSGGWENPGDVSILLGNGDGTFQSAVNYAVGSHPLSVFSADFDGDGDNDLTTANGWSDNVSILLGNGDGTFQAADNYDVVGVPFSVFSADFNGDGNNDLATANYVSDDVSILPGNGDGTFQSAVNYAAGIKPYSVFSADFDGDGDNDLATANKNSHNVSILLNQTDNGGSASATVVEPDIMYVFYANSIYPITFDIYVGNFSEGHTAEDVNGSSIMINSSIVPTATSVIPSYPGFNGEVLHIEATRGDFVESYGWPYDTTTQNYTVAGTFTKGTELCTPFSAQGDFTLIGHTSGDLDNNGKVDIADITYLTAYLFAGGPAPQDEGAGDVNGSGGLNVSDITYLVSYLFLDGPKPDCN
ncbi:MAG: FG-GAP-like repeat-containing protein, partial [candidate division Zixibacteria bacterium]|nr:FG-GAP-like repeat-containing protein [candidate division Zixibacteria bacterium]